MRQFSASVRLSGSLYNEVFKSPITVPEIICLRAIHGAEAVHGIKEVEPVDRTDAEERDRIAHLYGKAIAKRQEIVGGLGAIIGFAGPLADAAPGIPVASEVKRSGGRKPKEPVVEDEPELEGLEA